MKNSDYIHFDWAIKRILRDKANFVILEGFLSVLLDKKIKIIEILESEGNQQTAQDKFNRVDMMAKAENGDLFIVEVQMTHDLYYMQRILYGTSKAVTEHIKLGESYKHVKKVYSINVLYVDIGKGEDFIYRGTTTFRGMFLNDELKVRGVVQEQNGEKKAALSSVDVFPEYYLIRVGHFNKIATTPIEEWIAYLKDGDINNDTDAPGLPEAREKLRVALMTDSEKRAYTAHKETIMRQNDTVETYVTEGVEIGKQLGRAEGEAIGMQKGLVEGEAIGIQKGREEEQREMVKSMKAEGMSVELIARITKLSVDEIEKL